MGFACKSDKDCMGCKGEYCQAFSEEQSFCAKCSDLEMSDCGEVDSCTYNAKAQKCMQNMSFEMYKMMCGKQVGEACKECGGQFRKGACDVKKLKDAKKVKCKKLTTDLCAMVPGCSMRNNK